VMSQKGHDKLNNNSKITCFLFISISLYICNTDVYAPHIIEVLLVTIGLVEPIQESIHRKNCIILMENILCSKQLTEK
jgi:hypothetical protein